MIAYHEDSFDSGGAFTTRSQYYGAGAGTPRVLFDGTIERRGGLPSGSMYSQYVYPYDQAAAVSPTVDFSLSLESANQVRVEIANTSSQRLSGVLHVALVERHRFYRWMDMDIVDFVCRAMLPNAAGQTMTLDPGANAASTQQFSVQPDWNYCSIVVFFQATDKRILQGAMLPLESTIPTIKMSGGPATGAMWLRNSAHSIAWSSDRPLGAVQVEYSDNGGQSWKAIQTASSGTGQYSWTVPQINSSQCLLAVSDPYGGTRAVSGLFAIGYKGDFNADGVINEVDRRLLTEYLLENKAFLLPGADLNEDGVVDILDLVYFETLLPKTGAAVQIKKLRR
ncbi:MAG: dockerin type I repeat-containing protein [Acidobacteriia bacterium]|nr:dockerin type I repeat-containing protein [Terriglobia bacterium]